MSDDKLILKKKIQKKLSLAKTKPPSEDVESSNEMKPRKEGSGLNLKPKTPLPLVPEDGGKGGGGEGHPVVAAPGGSGSGDCGGSKPPISKALDILMQAFHDKKLLEEHMEEDIWVRLDARGYDMDNMINGYFMYISRSKNKVSETLLKEKVLNLLNTSGKNGQGRRVIKKSMAASALRLCTSSGLDSSESDSWLKKIFMDNNWIREDELLKMAEEFTLQHAQSKFKNKKYKAKMKASLVDNVHMQTEEIERSTLERHVTKWLNSNGYKLVGFFGF
jgi:hypothetical protein